MNMKERGHCDGAVQAEGSEGWHNCMDKAGHKGSCHCPHGKFTPTHYVKEIRGGTVYEAITEHNPRPATTA